jgi:hypothetical protein
MCPKGFFCPIGTTIELGGLTCGGGFLANCPKGTDEAQKYGIAAAFISLFIVVHFLFGTSRKSKNLQNQKHQQEMKLVQAYNSRFVEKPRLAPLKQTFDVEFDNISYGKNITLTK